MRVDPSAQTLSLLRSAPSDARVFDQLASVVYGELKGMAARYVGREAPGGTLQPTALVHEAYLRLVDESQIGAHGKTYFFGAAARAMRQVLIERARARQTQKRGGDRDRVPFEDPVDGSDDAGVDLLALDEALQKLAGLDERQAQVVELRFFGGLSVAEVAVFLGVSERTIKTDWKVARAWLRQKLGESKEQGF